ncbi:MAG: glycosyltransferase family 2 protein [Candidatus Aenigmarchaeota archaeon]|nr:glycosyltransferase family 2 protein [Candidatus Aenigmarchaeota archaeon]
MNILQVIYIGILITLSYFTIFHLILWFENRGNLKRGRIKDGDLPRVTVLVPAYNERENIASTLENLLAVDYPKSKLEIIVIDDGSKDNTFEIAQRFKSKHLKVIRKRNSGKASTLNYGIRLAKHDFVAVMDADSFLDKNALRQCMACFDDEKVAAVTSHILVKRTKGLWEKLQDIEYMIVAAMRKAEEYVNIIAVTPGPLGVYRKKDLVKVGGFDEKNLIEDVEIAWRLLKHGYKIRMAFDAMVYSIYPDNLKMWWRQRKRWVIGGLQTFFKYSHTMFDRKSHGVGNFIVPASLIGYILALLGTSIFSYIILSRLMNFLLYVIAALAVGANPLLGIDFSYNVDLLFVYGMMMFLISLAVLRLSFRVHGYRPNFFILLLFIAVYPLLSTLNLLISAYNFFRGERGWLTK